MQDIKMNNMAEVISSVAKNSPNKVMMIDTIKGVEVKRYTYGEANRSSKQIADYFSNELELNGENILLLLPDNSEMVLYIFGCAYSDNSFVIGSNINLSDSKTAQLVAAKIVSADITAVVIDETVDDDFIDKIYDFIDNRELIWISTKDVKGDENNLITYKKTGDDIAFIQYTSGTSNNPKGVILSHHNFIYGIERLKERCAAQADNVMISSLPLSHNLGLVTAFSMFIMRSTVVFMDVRELLVSPLLWLSLITRYEASIIGGINLFFILALKNVPNEQLADLDLSHIHTTFIGGEEIKIKALKMFIQKFAVAGFNGKSFFPGYGMTENTLLISTSKPGVGLESLFIDEKELRNNNLVVSDETHKEVPSNGFVFENDDIAIVDPETKKRLDDDFSIGEIWISGPAVAKGYINNEKAEKERFHWKLENSPREYLRTGDIGFFKEGRLYITGRTNDLIIIDGNNYYAHEFDLVIGNSIENIPVGNVASFSEIDSEGNEKLVVALGYANDDYPDMNTANKVSCDIKNVLFSNYKVPISKIVFTDNNHILKTSIGKIRRNVIKNNYLKDELKINYIWKDGMIYEAN